MGPLRSHDSHKTLGELTEHVYPAALMNKGLKKSLGRWWGSLSRLHRRDLVERRRRKNQNWNQRRNQVLQRGQNSEVLQAQMGL